MSALLPAGLSYTPPADPGASGGMIAGTQIGGSPAAVYTLPVSIEIIRIPVQVTMADATAVEGGTVEFVVTLVRAVSRPLTVE